MQYIDLIENKSSTISRRLLIFVLLNHPITNMSGADSTLQHNVKVDSGCFGLQAIHLYFLQTSEHLISIPEGFGLLQSSCSQQLIRSKIQAMKALYLIFGEFSKVTTELHPYF